MILVTEKPSCHYLDYVPIISNLTNLYYIFHKFVLDIVKEPSQEEKTHYYTYLKEKSYIRSLFLVVLPIISNIVVAIIDFIKIKQEKANEESEEALLKKQIKDMTPKELEILEKRLSELEGELKVSFLQVIEEQEQRVRAEKQDDIDLEKELFDFIVDTTPQSIKEEEDVKDKLGKMEKIFSESSQESEKNINNSLKRYSNTLKKHQTLRKQSSIAFEQEEESRQEVKKDLLKTLEDQGKRIINFNENKKEILNMAIELYYFTISTIPEDLQDDVDINNKISEMENLISTICPQSEESNNKSIKKLSLVLPRYMKLMNNKQTQI